MAFAQIKTHGNTTLEGIEISNFSTEETLAALLEQFKAFSNGFTKDWAQTHIKTEKAQTKLEKLLSGMVGGAAGGAVGSAVGAGGASNIVSKMLEPTLKMFTPLTMIFEDLAILAPEVLLAVAAFKLVSIGLTVFQGALNLISRSITSLFSITGNLIGTFTSGKLTMSDYFSAVARGTESIPIIGTFFGMLVDGISLLDGWNQSLLDLTKIGANFNGSLSGLIGGAADAGLTVEQFSSVIKNNADGLATFGSIMNGVSVWTKVTKTAMQDYSGQLASLNISFADFAELSPKILSIFGASMKAHGASTSELTKSTIDLIAQFDAMSQLTGKSREQQAEDLQKLTSDAAWQQAMTKMSGDEAAKYGQVLSEIGSTSSNAYAELYKLTVLGIPPLTKELQTILATTPGLNAEFERMTAIVKSGASGAELGKQLDDVAADMVNTGLKAGQSFETLIAASTAGLSGSATDIAAVQKELLAHTQDFRNKDGSFNETRYKEQLAIDRAHLEAQNKVSGSLLLFSNLITKLHDDLYTNVIAPFVDKLGGPNGPIQNIVNGLTKQGPAIQHGMEIIVGWVTKFGNWLNDDKTHLQEYIDDFLTIIKTVIGVIIIVTKFIMGMVKFVYDNWDSIKPLLKIVAYGILTVLVVVVGALVGAFILLGLAVWPVIDGLSSLGKMIGIITGDIDPRTGKAYEDENTGKMVGAASGVILGGAGGEAYDFVKNLSEYFTNNKVKEQKQSENVETQSSSKTSDEDASSSIFQDIKDILMNHTDILNRNAENTERGAKFSKKTAVAVT